ncbi:aldehyde ferredoxin oxidoreductase family protein [Chloroflexota bacterium]
MTDGWAGTILDVDLSTGEITKKPLPRELAVKYIGGSGLGARILYDELKPGTDPLGPDSIIVVTQGVLSGTTAPACGRYDMVIKSPQTNLINRSNGGGFFGPELKWAGYDLVIIRGRSAKPVYLWIEDDHVEIKDAAHLWGKDTWITQDMIRKELGDFEIQTLKIGPAGENMCYLSCVVGDLGRAAGRFGTGTVWGSKKLKAIAVRGTQGVSIARPEEFGELCLSLYERAKKDPLYQSFIHYGTHEVVSDKIMSGSGRPGSNLMAAQYHKAVSDKDLACFGCDLHCSHRYSVKEGKYKGTTGDGLEATAVISGGYYVKIDNPAFVCMYNTLCNRLGLDASRVGRRVKVAMQLYEDGIITTEDTGGIELTWGNEDAYLAMMDKIVHREGLGEVLDSPPSQWGEKLGKAAEPYVFEVKDTFVSLQGLYDTLEMTLGFYLSTKGRDHLVGANTVIPLYSDEVLKRLGKERYGDPRLFAEPWYVSPQKAQFVYDHENDLAVHDMTGTCKLRGEHILFVEGVHREDMARLISAATGIDFTPRDLEKAAERQMLLEKAFNAREGIRRIDDYPYSFYWQKKHNRPHPKCVDMPSPITIEDYDRILDTYYRRRGCDPATGIPTREKLEELGLDDVADDLTARGIKV